MLWLIDDIRANGPARTESDAIEREAPAFARAVERSRDGGDADVVR
ncbi:hypothetical protein AB0P40_43420 [Streptomyces sp. NPDC079189]